VHGKAKAHFQLARVQLRMKENVLAKAQLQMSLQVNPQLADAQDMLAQVSSEAQPAVQAVAHSEPAVTIARPDGNYLTSTTLKPAVQVAPPVALQPMPPVAAIDMPGPRIREVSSQPEPEK